MSDIHHFLVTYVGPHYLAFQDKPDTLAVHGIELVAHGDRKQKVGSHKTLENERRFRRQLLPSRFLCLVTHLPCHVGSTGDTWIPSWTLFTSGAGTSFHSAFGWHQK